MCCVYEGQRIFQSAKLAELLSVATEYSLGVTKNFIVRVATTHIVLSKLKLKSEDSTRM